MAAARAATLLLPATAIVGDTHAAHLVAAILLLAPTLLFARNLLLRRASAHVEASTNTPNFSGTWLNTSLQGDAARFYTAVGVAKSTLLALQQNNFGVNTITHTISMDRSAITTAINYPTPMRVHNKIDGREHVASRTSVDGEIIGQERYRAFWEHGKHGTTLVMDRAKGASYSWRRWLHSDRVMVVELDTGRGQKLRRIFHRV